MRGAYLPLKTAMKPASNATDALKARIEEILQKGPDADAAGGRSIGELLQDLSIYHQELEFQNEELRRIQQDLEASRKHYRELFDHSPAGYVVYDRDLIIHAANQTFLDMLGTPGADLISHSITKVIHPGSQDAFYFFHNALWDGKGERVCELQLSKDNDILVVSVLANHLQQGDASLIRMALVDITKEKQLAQSLAEERNRYSMVANYVYNWEYWRSPDGSLFYVSPSCEQISGYKPEEFIARPGLLSDIVHPDDRALFHDHEKEDVPEVGGDVVSELDFRIVKKDGSICWISHICRKIVAEDGTYLGIRSCNQDITERKRVQLALEGREADYRQLFENITQGFALHEVITDESGEPVDYRFLKVNPSFEKLTGLREADLVGKTVREVLPDTEEIWIREYGHVALSGEARQFESFSQEIGKYFDVHAFCPKIGQFGVVFTDVSERVSAMQDTELACEKAERSDKMKTLFLNNLSHEIRTPLNSIVGFSEFLNEEGLDREQIRHLTGVISQSSAQLLHIINDIVSISSIEAGLAEVYPSEVSVEQIMCDAYQHYHAKAAARGLRIRANNMVAHCHNHIMADAGKLHQVLYQLIENAIKFTEQGHIEFGVLMKDGYLKFYVADTGIGIPEALRAHVFERFEQVETEQSKIRGGLGLGLPIARAHVELMGGTIWYESGEGSGTTFFFTTPWKPKRNEAASKHEKRVLGPGEKRTILVAEDEENNFELANVILSSNDFDVLHAWDGRQAVDMVRDNPAIDLVLMDIKMPVMNGLDATREIKSFQANLPVIALTAYALPGDREKVFESGCDDYIAKPISLHDFLEKVMRFF